MSKPLLDLSLVEPERPFIRVGGERYEFALPDDLGIVERARLARLWRRVGDLRSNIDDLSDDDVGELVHAIDELVKVIVPGMPAEVRAQLRDVQKLRIAKAFLSAVGVLKGAITPPPLNQLTGESSSPGSSDSTVETSMIG